MGFSVASVVLSYFLVAGGMFTSMLGASYAHVHGDLGAYLLLAVGAFAGGYVAARASRGKTILEPALGGLAVVGTLVALVATTSAGKLVWATQHDAVVKTVALLGASGGAGALLGAWVAETFFGEAPLSTLPWFVYTAFATFGACFLVTMIAVVLAAEHDTGTDALAKMMLAGLAIGCALGGIAVGSSARSRPLFAALVGGGVGVLGFCLLATHGQPADHDQKTTLVVLAIGGALVTWIGAAIGWALFGKRAAG
jgi:hypothetical protein